MPTDGFKWVDAKNHKFKPRMEWGGPKLPTLSSSFDNLTAVSRPFEYFQKVDAPEAEYESRAVHSENYRSWRHANGLDGKSKNGQNKKCYDGAAEIAYDDMRILDAGVLLR